MVTASNRNPCGKPLASPRSTWEGAGAAFGAGPVDVNRASAEDLRRIPGVGPRTVERLLAIRQTRAVRLRDLQRLHLALRSVRPWVVTADHRPGRCERAVAELWGRSSARQLELFGSA